jgi:hypothetical protein
MNRLTRQMSKILDGTALVERQALRGGNMGQQTALGASVLGSR